MRDDLQPPVDIPFAPIDKYPAISNYKRVGHFFSPLLLLLLLLLLRDLTELPAEAGIERDLEVFPLSMKVVDWPAMPSLSVENNAACIGKSGRVIPSGGKGGKGGGGERIMERVERKTKPLKIPRRTCMAVQKTNVRSFTKNNEEEWEVF